MAYVKWAGQRYEVPPVGTWLVPECAAVEEHYHADIDDIGQGARAAGAIVYVTIRRHQRKGFGWEQVDAMTMDEVNSLIELSPAELARVEAIANGDPDPGEVEADPTVAATGVPEVG